MEAVFIVAKYPSTTAFSAVFPLATKVTLEDFILPFHSISPKPLIKSTKTCGLSMVVLYQTINIAVRSYPMSPGFMIPNKIS
uniref:Uncharacterized protein n=1 Tax=uncultured marine virus TaxID=186617 RepID=A0A0F7L5G1_9VIRU|nr:hypothetical protein [uncultured marine virus]